MAPPMAPASRVPATGPGVNNRDVSRSTRVPLGRDQGRCFRFRSEFYNAFNHPQFGNPGTQYRTANFGVITQTSVAPRLIQFGLKYVF